MEEVTEDRRKPYNEEFDFSSSPNTIRLIKSRKMRYPYRLLMGKFEVNRPLGKSRHRQGIPKWILKK
jgi:hypothetical protein